MNQKSVCCYRIFSKLCLVDGLVLEYIEWKVYLSELNNFDPIEKNVYWNSLNHIMT